MSLLMTVEKHVAVLTINRPEVMNAMDPETYRALSDAWIEVRDNPDIWAAVITGAVNGSRPPEKQAFTSGADLRKTIPRTPSVSPRVSRAPTFSAGRTKGSTLRFHVMAPA